jgi:hypothetical protein
LFISNIAFYFGIFFWFFFDFQIPKQRKIHGVR